MGNIERVMTREAISQILADAGINRETLVQMVKEIIDEKVEKSIKKALHDDFDIYPIAKRLVEMHISAEVCAAVRSTLNHYDVAISVKNNVKFSEPEKEG